MLTTAAVGRLRVVWADSRRLRVEKVPQREPGELAPAGWLL